MPPARPPSRPPTTTRGASSAGLLAVVAVIAVIAVVATVAGCGSAIDDRPAKWSFISATITEPACATVSCHSAVAQRAGVDLSARDIGYKVLIDRHFVLPGNPNLSSVMALMHAQGSIRMPPDLPLPEVDIALIGKWIGDGAPND